jgi:DNA (cytosine-5)-methyltransferase 1
MTIHTCQKCGKKFRLKGDYTRHVNRKISCDKKTLDEKIKETVKKVVKEEVNNICNGEYPEGKHHPTECYSLDPEWDLKQMDKSQVSYGSSSKKNGHLYEEISASNIRLALRTGVLDFLMDGEITITVVDKKKVESFEDKKTTSKSDLIIDIYGKRLGVSVKCTNGKNQLHLTSIGMFSKFMSYIQKPLSQLCHTAMEKYLGVIEPTKEELKTFNDSRHKRNIGQKRYLAHELKPEEQKAILDYLKEYQFEILDMACRTGFCKDAVHYAECMLVSAGKFNETGETDSHLIKISEYINSLRIGDPYFTETGNIMLSNNVSFQRKGSGNPTCIQINKLKKNSDYDIQTIFIDMPKKYKGLSLFACAGIAEHNLHDTDVDIVLANELLPERCKLYQQEYPDSEMVCGDINKKLSIIVKKAKVKNVDFIIATPPCQSFSTAGSNTKGDKRSPLFIPLIKIIKKIKPLYVMIENVPSFMKSRYDEKNKMTVAEKFEKELGEEYHISTKILNASDYGVPQTRKRSITLLTNKKCVEWKHPVPEEKTVTVRDAIGHLPSLESGERSDVHTWHVAKKHNEKHILWMKNTPTGKSAFENKVHFPKKNGRKIKGFKNTYKRMQWDVPAPTITMASGCISSQENVHPGNLKPDGTYDNARALTVYEIMLLTNLRDDWLNGIKNEKILRDVIGEAIPPLMALKIIQTIPKKNKCISIKGKI